MHSGKEQVIGVGGAILEVVLVVEGVTDKAVKVYVESLSKRDHREDLDPHDDL